MHILETSKFSATSRNFREDLKKYTESEEDSIRLPGTPQTRVLIPLVLPFPSTLILSIHPDVLLIFLDEMDYNRDLCTCHVSSLFSWWPSFG